MSKIFKDMIVATFRSKCLSFDVEFYINDRCDFDYILRGARYGNKYARETGVHQLLDTMKDVHCDIIEMEDK